MIRCALNRDLRPEAEGRWMGLWTVTRAHESDPTKHDTVTSHCRSVGRLLLAVDSRLGAELVIRLAWELGIRQHDIFDRYSRICTSVEK